MRHSRLRFNYLQKILRAIFSMHTIFKVVQTVPVDVSVLFCLYLCAFVYVRRL
jgi:hypothetical protein